MESRGDILAVRKAAGLVPWRLEADFADGETGIVAGEFFVGRYIAERPAGNIRCEIDVRRIRMIHETCLVRVKNDLRGIEGIHLAVPVHEFLNVIGRRGDLGGRVG
jgi:hypothetical protein